MTDVYAQRGYGAIPVGFGEKPAVVVIDFQRTVLVKKRPAAQA